MEIKNYIYKAQNELGRTVKGKIEAIDKESALIKLRRMYPTVMSVEEPNILTNLMSMDLGGKKIKAKKLAVLCNELAVMLRSGIPISRATEMLGTQSKDKKIKKLLTAVSEDLRSGKSLSTAFERRGAEALTPTFFETIRAGEASGNLEESFQSLSKYYDDQSRIASKIKVAMFYPTFVLVLAAIVIVIVMIKVIPELAKVFTDFGSELPGMTKALISMSQFFQDYWWLILIILAVLIIGYRLIRKNANVRNELDRLKFKVPIVGNFLKTNYSAQFANTLSMLLHAGVKMQDALEITSRTIKNSYYSQAVLNLSEAIRNGRGLSKTMERYQCFPPILIQMVSVGEETGELENTLRTIGKWYTEEADRAASSLASKLEPIMLVIVAIFAAFVLFSIYIPLFEVYDMF